jgi:hypothetical protein
MDTQAYEDLMRGTKHREDPSLKPEAREAMKKYAAGDPKAWHVLFVNSTEGEQRIRDLTGFNVGAENTGSFWLVDRPVGDYQSFVALGLKTDTGRIAENANTIVVYPSGYDR